MTREEIAAAAAAAGYGPQDVQRMNRDAIKRFVLQALSDDYLTEQEEAGIVHNAALLGEDHRALALEDPDLGQRLVIAQVNAGRLQPIASPQLICKRGEVVYLEWPAQLLKTVVKREFRAGYSGFSFPIGKTGIRYRVGGARGHSVVVGTEVAVDDSGILSISSQRTVFIGGAKTMEMPYSKLVNLSVFSDGVQFHQANRVNAPLFRLGIPGSHSGELVAALVQAAVQQA